jgi:hypothetical protein
VGAFLTRWGNLKQRFLEGLPYVSEGSPDDPDLPPSELDEEEIAELAAAAEEADLWGDLDGSHAVFEFSGINEINSKLQAIQDDDVTMA